MSEIKLLNQYILFLDFFWFWNTFYCVSHFSSTFQFLKSLLVLKYIYLSIILVLRSTGFLISVLCHKLFSSQKRMWKRYKFIFSEGFVHVESYQIISWAQYKDLQVIKSQAKISNLDFEWKFESPSVHSKRMSTMIRLWYFPSWRHKLIR